MNENNINLYCFGYIIYSFNLFKNGTEIGKEVRKGHLTNVLGIFTLIGIALAVLACIQFRLQVNELKRESYALQHQASQLVGQHDAHLTALSAIALANTEQHTELFLDVSAAISRFYTRIYESYLIPFDTTLQGIGTGELSEENINIIRDIASEATKMPILLPHPLHDGKYLLIKRSPNADTARYVLILGIDAKKLLTRNALFWSKENIQIRLSLPDGTVLVGNKFLENPQFIQRLESDTQPLWLETKMHFELSDLLPIWQVFTLMIIVLSSSVLVRFGFQQRMRLKQAEQEAELARVEAKLTHSMRINAMGEMASGMAHELTQPLTAIFAQLQASSRLLKQGNTERLTQVLLDSIEQSRRAASILERLRNWSRPQRREFDAFDIRIAIRNVMAIFASDIENNPIKIMFKDLASSVLVKADQVEMEQVLHNLLRNSIEAQSENTKICIELRLTSTNHHVVIEVIDNGPGVDPDILPNLFTPFTTTRDTGTGLGLALSQRLVERANGELNYVESRSGAIFRITLPFIANTM